ncbi:hypothetical protein BV509_01025 [Rhodovulum sulfidophilum]|nr:hypothetical protein BV509_01025 [Rhodovulum sulfidophilum]
MREVANTAGVPYDQLKSLHQGKNLRTNAESALAVARAFGVSLEDFIDGRIGTSDSGATGPVESEVELFRGEKPGVNADLTAAARAMTPDISAPAFYVLGRHLPSISLLSGDVLVCDLHPPPEPDPGSIVLVQIVDEATGTAETVVRRLYPPYLAGGPTHDARPLRFDPASMSIMGQVVASFRYCG